MKVWLCGVGVVSGLLAACGSNQTAVAGGLVKPGIVLTVPGAVQGRRYLGLSVEVRGFDSGWQGGCKGAPPVSRSDWHLTDGGQCLYVHGPHPEPRPDIHGKPRVVKVRGLLRETGEGILYLEATPSRDQSR